MVAYRQGVAEADTGRCWVQPLNIIMAIQSHMERDYQSDGSGVETGWHPTLRHYSAHSRCTKR